MIISVGECHMNKKKIDANEFWEKRELKQSWGKVLLSIVIVCFTLFYGAYCLDMYMGAHNLTFVKFNKYGGSITTKSILLSFNSFIASIQSIL